MFHCGDLKLRGFRNKFGMTINHNKCCHPELVSGSPTERIVKYPLLEERDRVRCLAERKKIEILRSSFSDLLQSNSLSLRMTCAFDNSNKCCHPERSEGALTEQIIANYGIVELKLKSKFAKVATSSQPSPQGEGEKSHAEFISASLFERIDNFPSPKEEGVGERVVSLAKLEPLKQLMAPPTHTDSLVSPPLNGSLCKVQGDLMQKMCIHSCRSPNNSRHNWYCCCYDNTNTYCKY